MNISFALKYPTRSLVRGGPRSVMAILCVAVGVMALVALQTVSFMLEAAFTVNARDANGGDIAVRQQQGFTSQDLSYFDSLKKQGTISMYTTSVWLTGQLSVHDSSKESFIIYVVDTKHFPLTQPPAFKDPGNGTIASLVKENQVVVTQSFLDLSKKKSGESFDLHIEDALNGSRVIRVKIAGVITDSSVFIQAAGRGTVVLSQEIYGRTIPNRAILSNTVFITTTSQADNNQAMRDIQSHFPNAQEQTPEDALKQWEENIASISKLMEIAGLLVLLIGGVGIVNTMQVLLSRRKMEIAMLKTIGYQRLHLTLLFGAEAGLLGLTGGCIGMVAAIGVSSVVRQLTENTLQVEIPFILSPVIIGGGAGIGIATALIFGLIPIVQAANIRPLHVLRNMVEGGETSSRVGTVFLLAVLSLLFWAMATVILHNDMFLGAAVVYGGFLLLGVASFFFHVIAWCIEKLPVPEHWRLRHLALWLVCVGLTAGIFYVQPTLGEIMFVIVGLVIIVLFLPQRWKATTKMALRNIGRQRGRTATTLLTLFVGIFAIGMIQVVGQNLRNELNTPKNMQFNISVRTTGEDTQKVQKSLTTIPGLTASTHFSVAETIPTAINGMSFQVFLNRTGTKPADAQKMTLFLNTMEGYDLAHGQIPDTSGFQVTGQNLNVNDTETNYAVVDDALMRGGLHIGDTITLESVDHLSKQTITIAGFYQQAENAPSGGAHVAEIWAPIGVVKALQLDYIDHSEFLLKVNENQIASAINRISTIIPNADILDRGANNVEFANTLLNNLLSVLLSVASLSLLASMAIIANAVALAMLERRREIGILKAVGYTSRSILSEVVIENGMVGGTAGLLAVIVIAVATQLVGVYVYKDTFSVNMVLAAGLFGGSTVLAAGVAVLVAWGAVHIRPLEVLRNE